MVRTRGLPSGYPASTLAAAAQYVDAFVANVKWEEVNGRYERAREELEFLTAELALPRGKRSVIAWSTSVWKVGSFSTRPPPLASTVTVCAADPTFKPTCTSVGTVERTSTSCVCAANPVALTTR